jgi:hypothetical protein
MFVALGIDVDQFDRAVIENMNRSRCLTLQ